MFVKPPRERSLMPQYHLADRGTQRKRTSMKWQMEGKRGSERRCSVLLTDKIRRESGWSGYVHHQFKPFKESLYSSLDVEQECQTASEDNALLKEEARPELDGQHIWHCRRNAAALGLMWSWWDWEEEGIQAASVHNSQHFMLKINPRMINISLRGA